jgi:hypothetical protein
VTGHQAQAFFIALMAILVLPRTLGWAAQRLGRRCGNVGDGRSPSLARILTDRDSALLTIAGPSRILFGSDCPFAWRPRPATTPRISSHPPHLRQRASAPADTTRRRYCPHYTPANAAPDKVNEDPWLAPMQHVSVIDPDHDWSLRRH